MIFPPPAGRRELGVRRADEKGSIPVTSWPPPAIWLWPDAENPRPGAGEEHDKLCEGRRDFPIYWLDLGSAWPEGTAVATPMPGVAPDFASGQEKQERFWGQTAAPKRQKVW
jgi:hypothetical protein